MLLRQDSPESAGVNPVKLKVAEEAIQEYVKAGKSHAFVFLATRKGIIFSHKAFGTLSHEQGSPALRTDTIFPMSSITKPIAATAALILYEEGKLDINAPIVSYVPEFTGKGKEKALVHQLMTHSSGMNDDTIESWWKENKDKVVIPPLPRNQDQRVWEYLWSGLAAPLWKQPGVEMSYCSWGLILLSEIIRRTSGQSFESFIRERIFDPLGMKDSFLIVPQRVKDRIVQRPSHLDNGWYLSKEALETPYASGGLYSTAYDLAVFGQMLLDKGSYSGIRILRPETVKEMTRNQIPGLCSQFFDEFFEEAGWGYCWDLPYGKNTIGKLVSPEAISHAGRAGAMILADPHYDLFWAMLFIDYSDQKTPFTFPGVISDMVIEAIET
jgi:CubicO group peptidase (beta-lactamase class C family)